eukprot:403349095
MNVSALQQQNKCNISKHSHQNSVVEEELQDNGEIELENGNPFVYSVDQIEVASNFNSNNFNEDDPMGPTSTGNIEANQSNSQNAQDSRALRFKRSLEVLQLTEEEMATESILVFFNALFDLAGVASAVFIATIYLKQNVQTALFVWFMIYGVLSLASFPFQVVVMKNICTHKLTRKLKQRTNVIDCILLPVCIAGYIINYSIDDNLKLKKSTTMIILVALIVFSVRLLKVVLVMFVKYLWQPLINLIEKIGRDQPVQAQKKLLDKIPSIDYEKYLALTTPKVTIQQQEQLDADLETLQGKSCLSSQSENQKSNQVIPDPESPNFENEQDIRPSSVQLDKTVCKAQQNKSQEVERLCSICLIDFDQDSKITPLPCKSHYYHTECITQWLKKNCICPVCRHKVNVQNLKELNQLLIKN